ncbi:sensor histidine kinase [Subtercola boreus]|nr:histidine kinase [Subtercola boreus]
MTPDERPATPPDTATVAGRSPVRPAPAPDSRLDDFALPKPPGVFRLFFARHAWVVDGSIVVLYGLPTILIVGVSLVMGRADWVGDPLKTVAVVAGSAIMLVALYIRRRHPLVLVVATGLGILLVTPFFEGLAQVPSLVALYGVAVYVSSRSALVAFALLSVVRIIADLIALGGDFWGGAAMASASIFLMLVGTLVGINVGNRQRYVEALIDRAAQLGRERDQQALLSAASERARIAREMHDIVAHSLTVMVALADGADRTVAQDPARAQEAIRQVAETGRTALADMRVVLGVLAQPLAAGASQLAPASSVPVPAPPAPEAPAERTQSALSEGSFEHLASFRGPNDAPTSLSPQPGHGDLDALIASYRSAGMVVVYTVMGEINPDPGIQLAVYRIVQEALTNSLRYAPDPKHVTVTVVFSRTDISVTVSDQGQSQVAATSIGTGHGIVGMRERALGYGGTLEAGPTTAGGWQVRAKIPETRQPGPAAERSSAATSPTPGTAREGA